MRLIDADVLFDNIVKSKRATSVMLGLVNDAPTVTQWVSIQDKMPDNNDRVLMFNNGVIKTDIFNILKDVWYEDDKRKCDFTHWMPIPPPPTD